jgi:hypothetical protein
MRAADTVQHARTLGETEPGIAALLTDRRMHLETHGHRQGAVAQPCRPAPVRSSSRRAPRPPACSKGATITALPRAIWSRSVSLSAADLRPERRSDDGQAILKLIWMGGDLYPDLVFLGGRRWVRTTGPSLVRIVSTTPLVHSAPYRCRSWRAAVSTKAHLIAPLSGGRSHWRSHRLMVSRLSPGRQLGLDI